MLNINNSFEEPIVIDFDVPLPAETTNAQAPKKATQKGFYM